MIRAMSAIYLRNSCTKCPNIGGTFDLFMDTPFLDTPFGPAQFEGVTLFSSGVAPANQTKERSVHEPFAGAFRNQSSM